MGAFGPAAGTTAGAALSNRQRKRLHAAIGGAIVRVAAAEVESAGRGDAALVAEVFRCLDKLAPARDLWVLEWGAAVRTHCAGSPNKAAQVGDFGSAIDTAAGQRGVPALLARELAIECYERVLEVHTREAYPEDWARTQMNLGAAYYERIRGEAASNKESAIGCYERALEVHTRE
eukprot:COSAG01_NODE_18613_length_1064_cov_2.305699_1_plen_175_part_01